MNQQEEKSLAKWFDEYVRHFAGKDGKLTPMLQVKFEHSRRVADIAAEIAEKLNYGGQDIRTARTLGLFHDVGRFTQFADHQTFRDELSFNHGQRGAEVMENCAPLAACSKKDRRRIIVGIRHHNRAHLPEGLEPDTMQFVKLARDVDKLDIFKMLYLTWKSGDLIRNPDIALMVKIDGPINPAALNDIRRKQTVSMRNVKSLADFFLLQLSWVYDLNFRPAYQRLISQKVIDHIAEVLPASPEIKEQIKITTKHVKAQLLPGMI